MVFCIAAGLQQFLFCSAYVEIFFHSYLTIVYNSVIEGDIVFENEELRKWLLFLGLLVLSWAATKVNKILFTQMRKKKNELKLKFFERFNAVVIVIVTIILAFSVFGGLSELWKTLLGGTAVITAVLAFTAQDIIKDILAGFMISVYKPFEIGNRIELENGAVGIVKDITMRHIALNLLDNTVCVIPNSKLNAMSVINYSYHSGLKAKQFTFHIAYNSDVRKAIKVIREAIISSSYTVPGIKKDYGMDYAPVYFMDFDSSSLVLKTTVYFPPDVPTEVMTSDVNLRIDLALNENGIEIPYNFVNVVQREIEAKQDGGKLIRSGRPYVTEDMIIKTDGTGMKEAIEKTEKFGNACGLNRKQVLRLRLLSEEALTMIRSILQNTDAYYHIARTKDTYYLHLKSHLNPDVAQRQQLLAMSSTGTNAAPMGLMDKISWMIRTSQSEKSPAQAYLMSLGLTDVTGTDGTIASWSLKEYKTALENSKEKNSEAAEAWDELERSIVSSIADDISVRITRSNVDMVIKKTFYQEL